MLPFIRTVKGHYQIFQRGVVVDKKAPPMKGDDVFHFPIVEDGNFDRPVSKDPAMVGTTDGFGMFRLPNRPVREVRTWNGFRRHPNPFGNINVVGQRGSMLVRVTKNDRPCHFWLEITEFNVAWFWRQKEKFVVVLKTPYRSVHSPLPPSDVKVERVDEHYVRVTWNAPAINREQQYFDRAIGFRAIGASPATA